VSSVVIEEQSVCVIRSVVYDTRSYQVLYESALRPKSTVCWFRCMMIWINAAEYVTKKIGFVEFPSPSHQDVLTLVSG
jgi:hypothetical protein